MARVRACNSVNLKLGGIIEPLLKIVNVLGRGEGGSLVGTNCRVCCFDLWQDVGHMQRSDTGCGCVGV